MAAHEITDSDRRNIAKTIPSYFSFGDEKENNASEQKLSSADGEPSYSRRFSNTKEDSDGKIVKNEDKTDSNATHNGSNISKISKYQNTENLSSSLHVNDLSEKREKTDRNVYKFTFNLIFPPREEVHSAVFRIYTRTRRKPDEIIGVERKIRLYINTETEDLRDASRILVVEQNVYLLNSSWIDLDISPAVRVFKKNKSNAHNIEVEISADFLSVGGKGILEVVTAFASSLRPYLLIYGTSHKALYRENQEKVSHRVKRSTSSAEWEEEDGNSVWDDVEVFTGFPPQVNKGKKLGRKARRRRAKNSCKRKPLRVEFKEIDWDHWIIAPQTYEAYQCSGKCYYPLPSHLSPTKHAVIQNLIHSKQPESASRACCVPTELGPISLLYLEANVPTFNYDYSEMVVLECGCR